MKDLTTEQMQAIVERQPDATDYDFDSQLYWKFTPNEMLQKSHFDCSWRMVFGDLNKDFKPVPKLIKLSDIRAELSSRLSPTIDKSICLSNIAKNDTQSDLSIKNDSQSNSHQIASPCLSTSDGAESADSSVSDEKKLKPCPFCGGNYVHICKVDDSHAVSCRTRDCHGVIFKLGYGLFATEQEAIEAWNTRAEQSVIERVKLLKGATQFQLDDYRARQSIDVTDERTGAIKMCEHLINHINELFKEVAGDD